MTKPIKVAIAGFAGAGKTTFANALNNHFLLERKVYIIPIAYFMKSALSAIYPTLDFYSHEGKRAEIDVEITAPEVASFLTIMGLAGSGKEIPNSLPKRVRTPREMMQFYGTDIVWKIDPQAHVKLLIDYANKKVKEDPNTLFIVDDLRCLHELSALQADGGWTTVGLTRDGVFAQNHRSESETEVVINACDVKHSYGNKDMSVIPSVDYGDEEARIIASVIENS